MNDDHAPRQTSKCFKTGACGTIIAAVCCATPVLALALTSFGLAAVVPKLDYVLLPALLIFLLLALYGWKRGRHHGEHPK
jgi:mercuric ion transport protein